ncbi:MAG: sugar phosphate isomerase/epimerase, partial [Clostridia bacterium]
AAGIQLLYHNHDFEFVKLSEQYGLDFLYDCVPATYLQTELDTCWVNYAGENPAAYVRKYAGRCPVVHLKDFVGRKGDKQPYALIQADGAATGAAMDVQFEFRPVGHGCQDIPAIMTAGIESGASWFVVEQDLSVGRPALEAARMSRDYLRSIGY